MVSACARVKFRRIGYLVMIASMQDGVRRFLQLCICIAQLILGDEDNFFGS
jgi:hypothetical protein